MYLVGICVITSEEVEVTDFILTTNDFLSIDVKENLRGWPRNLQVQIWLMKET